MGDWIWTAFFTGGLIVWGSIGMYLLWHRRTDESIKE